MTAHHCMGTPCSLCYPGLFINPAPNAAQGITLGQYYTLNPAPDAAQPMVNTGQHYTFNLTSGVSNVVPVARIEINNLIKILVAAKDFGEFGHTDECELDPDMGEINFENNLTRDMDEGDADTVLRDYPDHAKCTCGRTDFTKDIDMHISILNYALQSR